MTEKEVLAKLREFREAIAGLQAELKASKEREASLAEKLDKAENDHHSEKSCLEKQLLELSEQKAEAEKSQADRKYTESDLKKLLEKASQKSKEKIEEYRKNSQNWESEYQKLSEKYTGLEATNRNLERQLEKYAAEKDIDDVLSGKAQIDDAIDEATKRPRRIEIHE